MPKIEAKTAHRSVLLKGLTMPTKMLNENDEAHVRRQQNGRGGFRGGRGGGRGDYHSHNNQRSGDGYNNRGGYGNDRGRGGYNNNSRGGYNGGRGGYNNFQPPPGFPPPPFPIPGMNGLPPPPPGWVPPPPPGLESWGGNGRPPVQAPVGQQHWGPPPQNGPQGSSLPNYRPANEILGHGGGRGGGQQRGGLGGGRGGYNGGGYNGGGGQGNGYNSHRRF